MHENVRFDLLRRALRYLAGAPDVWARVCVPALEDLPLPASALPDWVTEGLLAGGVVELAGGFLHARRWVTLQYGRPYFMTLDTYGREEGFVQDIWPETLALLERVRGTPPGRTADVGTGCGVIGIEAALAGHRVVATDIDEGALATAAWNAALHEVTLELRAGHLTAPLGDETFDLIVSDPHYGGWGDMLRIELLRDAPARLAPGGTLALATFLEWDADGAGVVESILRPLASRGARVSVTPIVPRVKTRWFTEPSPPSPGMVSRARVLIEVTRDAGPEVRVERPTFEPEVVVPLARLHGPRARRAEVRAGLDARTSGSWDRRPVASLHGEHDLEALEVLLEDCERGVLDLSAPIPFVLEDACRFGARTCVTSYAAIVDARGGVRPCARGEVVAHVDDDTATIGARMLDLRAALEARRGCASCAAERVCSKCTFPALLDEAAYCALVRRHATALPVLHRTLRILGEQHAESVTKGHLRLKLPGKIEPEHDDDDDDDEESPLPALRRALRGCALVIVDGAARLEQAGDDDPFPLAPALIPVVESIMDGATRGELDTLATSLGLRPEQVEPLLYILTARFG